MATSKRERQKAARREKKDRLEREAKRRRTIRRGVIIGVVAVVVIVTGALLFTNGSSTPTTTTTALASGTTTTTAPTTTTTGYPANKLVTQAQSNAKAVAAGCPASTSARVNNLSWKSAPAQTINAAKTYYATVKSTAGTFVIKLDASSAPITTNNFVFLSEQKYYNCTIFHRVIPGFAIQGGDPTGTGTGGPGYTIADEYPTAGSPTYPLYSVAMANTGQPHTGGSQFFIVSGPSGETLSAQYSLFGQVVSGFNAVKMMNAEGNSSPSSNGVPPTITYRILTVTITER